MKQLIDIIKNKAQMDNNPWVLIYSYSEIILEQLDHLSDKAKKIVTDDILEARIFNKHDELKIWKYQGKIKSRLFSETKLKNYEEYKENMLLWGDRVENNVLQEFGRGTEINFPIELTSGMLPLRVQVKNYYTFDNNGLIQFHDARLTGIVDKDGKEVK